MYKHGGKTVMDSLPTDTGYVLPAGLGPKREWPMKAATFRQS